ncbi:MAG TPA: hypothetical protein V6C84_22315 [Coleofasciculaceae cyanobacterium]
MAQKQQQDITQGMLEKSCAALVLINSEKFQQKPSAIDFSTLFSAMIVSTLSELMQMNLEQGVWSMALNLHHC